MRGSDLRRSVIRLRILGGLLLLAYLALAARATQLSVFDPRGAERGRAQTVTVLRVAPARGLITDRNGDELAVTIQAPSIYAVPRGIEDPARLAATLAPLVELPEAKLRERLSRQGAFVFLRRWVREDQAQAIEELGHGAVGVVREPRRAYPMGERAGRLLGFANIDGEGIRSVEQGWDDWLRGTPQQIAVERDALGRLLAAPGHDLRSSAGGDVALSIDGVLQADAEEALGEVVRATGAKGGVVVVLDPKRGDLLAVAEWPPFDPGDFRGVPYRETRAQAFLDAFEPGSSLKPIVVAAALEKGVLSKNDRIDCEQGRYRVPGKTLSDIKPHGLLDPSGILRVSSNIGAVKIGYLLGRSAHEAALRRFGFGARSGSGFPDESRGLLRSSDRWQPVDHATISFGQGISVTPVQLASALGVLANDGLRQPPRLVVARREPEDRWKSVPTARPERVVKARVARELRAMLGDVVSGERGTGRLAALEDIEVGGKTGTAQKLDPATGAYTHDAYRTWFVGMAPLADPEIVTVVMLDEPRGKFQSGGSTAAPLFGQVAARALTRRGIATRALGELPALARIDLPAPEPPAYQPAVVATKPAPAAAPPPPPPIRPRREIPEAFRLGKRVLLPDLTDLTDVQVRRWARQLDLPVQIRGRGFAVGQEPPAGTVVAGRPVLVHFESGPGEGG
ncbi:MAG: penicillin-binding transpeptidase domain-containing protein [Myxococcota bacterium]|nr:penicillin-binding transpeptidase domain-containing protein [Myxococcota bacterium]